MRASSLALGPDKAASLGGRGMESGTAGLVVTCGSQKRANTAENLGYCGQPDNPSPMPKSSLWFLLVYCSASSPIVHVTYAALRFCE